MQRRLAARDTKPKSFATDMNKPHSQTNAVRDIAGTIDPVDELAGTPGFDAAIDHDFGTVTEELTDSVSRRRWLQIMGASLALGGLSGCRYEEEKIAPFAFRPQGRIPGIPQKFASMLECAGVAQPLVSTNFDGRPIKLDGNPKHPASLGASSPFVQATILEFYDPDRLRTSMQVSDASKGGVKLMEDVNRDEMMSIFKSAAKDVAKVTVLSPPTSSPTMLRMKESLIEKGGKWLTFTSINDDNARAGAVAAFGEPVRPQYDFGKAKVIVTIDADPLMMGGDHIANSIGFGKGRDAESGSMSRMYSVESQFSTTGASADHRISVRSADIAGFLATLAAEIEQAQPDGEVNPSLGYRDTMLVAMAQDLAKNAGAGLIVVGETQPPEVHALVHSLNQKLGNAGKTVVYHKIPGDTGQSNAEAIEQLIGGAGSETLVVLGGNPVYGGPMDANVAAAISKAKLSFHVTNFRNETSTACKFVVAAAHALETWQDGTAADGSVCVGQPLINPLYEGMSDIEWMNLLLTGEQTGGMDLLKETHSLSGNDWTTAVQNGFVADSAAEPATVKAGDAPEIEATDGWKSPWDGETLEYVFSPSRSVYDGRYANNSWLQELPDFITKTTWDNVLLVSPKTAEELGLVQSTKATVTIGDQEIRIPVHVQPGQADGSIGLALGYGRTAAGRVGGDIVNRVPTVGQDVGKLRTAEAWNMVAGVPVDTLTPSGTRYRLAMIQEPWTIDDMGRNEIQNRMFRNKDKNESDRSALIREGSMTSYQAFLEKHPLGEHGHGDHKGHEHGDNEHSAAPVQPVVPAKRASATALPIVTNVSFDPSTPIPMVAVEDEQTPSDNPAEHNDPGEAEEGHHDGHHKPQWPEAFHMHHELFDITKGARELYTEENPSYANMWGMSIDLNKCIGCNSCTTACQAENNIPVVGREEVWRGREMHWIRIDRYFGNNLYNNEAAESDDKIIIHQPVACHHCENAPCETVCPVAATVHSSEGLNDMVYNRCIGTRYCGNNCPYKVRRFNYFNYSDAKTFLKYPGADKATPGDRMLQNLMMNPEVSIRSRGVMEKCTYCVQRIQNTKIQAKAEGNREIGPNEITTACQDACPTQAIKFGDLHNKESDVAKAHANPRAYSMLEELNNRPRTRYLARVRNVHPALMDIDDRDSIPKMSGH